MSQNLPQGLDLSGLPPEIRRKVEAGLARLSPEMRQHWEQQGSPLPAQLVAKAGGKSRGVTPPPLPNRPPPRPGGMDPPAHAPHHTNPRSKPQGHYNDTIRPGDGLGLRWLPLTVVLAVLVVAWFEF